MAVPILPRHVCTLRRDSVFSHVNRDFSVHARARVVLNSSSSSRDCSRILLVIRARISCECRLLFGSSYGIMDIPDCVNCGRACKGWPLEPETDKLERSQGRCDGRHGLHAASEGGEPFAFAQAQSIADGLSQAQVASVAFKLAARHVVH